MLLDVDDIIKVLNRYPNGTWLKIALKDGCIVSGVIDTIYETCNDFDENDSRYREYYACAFKISHIAESSFSYNYKPGMLIELSRYHEPTKIELEDGENIWLKEHWALIGENIIFRSWLGYAQVGCI